jgi:hypothetical protein
MKILIAIMCMAISATVSAKGSSHVQDGDESKAIGSCMVKVDDANTVRFLNVNYIRAIEIVKGESREADPKVVVIRMGSNYNNRSSYAIAYASEQKANDALEDFAYKVNNCGKKN